MGTPKIVFPPLHPAVGYGQLSISAPPVERGVHPKNAAGVWALEGSGEELATLEPAGPTQTAAVVAYSSNQAIYAESNSGPAVKAVSVSASGVYAASTSGRGLEGWSTSNYGASGDSQTFAGVRGTSVSAAGTEGWSTNNSGVFGTSQNGDGVYGVTSNPNASGIHGVGAQGGKAAQFDGTVQVNGAMNVSGNVNVGGDILFSGGMDCAEHFDLAAGEAGEPGTVMVIREGGELAPCSKAYDKKAAGVVSGAGQFRPAVLLGPRSEDGKRPPIALIGRVCCKVDADISPIEAGDLLTTSPTRGHAMKAADPAKAFGTVVGKALASLTCGKGLVPMIVCLQ
jgi:hypothetical protein